MRDLLTPPGHRGPLIAAGAVVLVVGVALEQFRVTPGAGVQFAVPALLAALLLWLALQGEMEKEPPAWASVLLVAGLLALAGALLRLADLFADPFDGGLPAGTLTWTSLAESGAAFLAARRRGSGVALLIGALTFGAAVLAGWKWGTDEQGVVVYRWLLLLLAVAYTIAALTVRGRRQRFCEQFANAGGVALLGIAAIGGLSLDGLPGGWAFVLLAGGLGLVAYAAADRAPGPAYLGALALAAFVLNTADSDTLLGWPLVLLLLGGGTMLIGLRPRRPLPPAPGTSTRPDDQPLAARSDGDT